MRFLRLKMLVLATAAAVLAVTAPSPAPAATIKMTPTLQKVIDGAKKEGKLTLEYGGGLLGTFEGAKVAAAGIRNMFGVTLDVTYTPGPSFAPMVARLYTEKEAGQPASTDVYYGTAVQLSPFLKRDLFRKIPWAQLYPGRITPEIVEADGQALRITTGTPGVLYNKRVAPQFGQVVTTADLLKPEYKGKLYTEPYLAGFDVLAADSMWGYPKTAAYVRNLSTQIGGLLRCGEPDRIASGEVPALAIDCTGTDENLAKYRNILGHVILHDAAMRRYDYLSIPQNAQDPDAGILFALYLSSPEGQRRVLLDLFGNDLDSYPETKTHARITALEKQGVKFTDVTTTWWSTQKDLDSRLKRLIKIITQR